MPCHSSLIPPTRISISLPKTLLAQLDSMIGQRGFDSRSRAIAEMINAQLAEHGETEGSQVMAGTDHSKANLQNQLSDIQHRHIAEVIRSLHVLLERHHTIEVILVQGPTNKLKAIANEPITCKGVKTGKLQLSTAVLPPLAR